MCRIAIVPPKMWDEDELELAFLGLEASNGGHGNGIATPDEVIRGIDTTGAAAMLAKKGGVFHTRLASVGGIDKKYLHPVKAGEGWIVQNGTWRNWSYYSNPGEKHDTSVIGRLVSELGEGVLASHVLSNAGVLIYIEGKEVRIYKRSSRTFGIYLTVDGKWMFVSEDITDYIVGVGSWFPLPDDTFIDLTGWEAKEFEPKRVEPTYNYQPAVYGTYAFDKPKKTGNYHTGKTLAEQVEKLFEKNLAGNIDFIDVDGHVYALSEVEVK